MKQLYLFAAALLIALTSPVKAERWTFSERLEIPARSGNGVFHHLEGAGRKHIAVSGEVVAVAWEDNSSASPQVYLTMLNNTAEAFAAPIQLSYGEEAFEPSIAALADGSFAVAWEQDAEVHAAIVDEQGSIRRGRLSGKGSGHASVAAHEGNVAVSWRQQMTAGWTIQVAVFSGDDKSDLESVMPKAVEHKPVAKPMQMPSIAFGAAGIGVAWEDRREGHTRMLYSHSADGAEFLPPDSLNEFYSGRTEYDKGNGSTRVSIAGFGEDEIVSAWMDKRRGGGYGIFASLGSEGGAAYGPNEKVHGPIGDREPHYNPSTAGNADGDFAVAWDDYRNGDSDIWISYYDGFFEWSDDLGPLVAGGPGEQTHPSIALDDKGNLHLLWMEKEDLFAPGRMWYAFGSRQPDE